MDKVAIYVPPGLGLVRLGNFMNSELLGRPTEMSWGVIFPSDPLGSNKTSFSTLSSFW